MQELRAFSATQVFQRRDQGLQVMAIDRADIVEAKLFKNRAGNHHALGMFLEAAGQLIQRRVLQHALGALARGRIELAAHQARQVFIQGPDRRADRHIVVVQNHQQIAHQPAVGDAGVVECFESHARGHRAVADDGHDIALLTLDLGGHCHAMSGRNRGA